MSTLCLCASRVCHVFNVFSTLCRCASCGRRLRDDVPRTARETCVQRGFADAIHDHNQSEALVAARALGKGNRRKKGERGGGARSVLSSAIVHTNTKYIIVTDSRTLSHACT